MYVIGKKVAGKAQGTCLQQRKFSEGKVLLHLVIPQEGWYWDGSRHSQEWSWQRERGRDPRCSGGENSTRRSTLAEGKKVGGISWLTLCSRREIQRGQSRLSREQTATEFPHFHTETVIPVTYGGTGVEGTGPFWGTLMKGQDNLLQIAYQKPVRSPVIPLWSRGVLPLFLLFYNSVCAGSQTLAAEEERSLTLPIWDPHLKP